MTRIISFCTFVAFIFIISSCDKEDPVPSGPEVSVNAPGYTINSGSFNIGVTKDSTVILIYSVDAPGIIEELNQTVDGVNESITGALGETSYSKQLVVDLPYEDKTIDVEIEVVDEHDQSSSASVSIVVEAIVPPAIPLTENQLITMGGSSSPSHFSRWDLDRPKGYGYWDLEGDNAGQILTMDSYYTTLSLGDSDLGQEQFVESGAKFVITDFTAEEYHNMENDLLLQDLEIEENYLQNIEVGQVIAFITNLDKLGVLYIKEYYDGTDDIDVEIKLQEK
ncbi:hypothetical protein [Membranihabitans maritimus]|uniref:hypothetical protein n=1 Tax=Membranihabitans maritimus TaxID=2904244 RepID=UPI001F4376F6|nr:hypothetical protein [Membranihabitans maritimus]